jgi:hypothetical protein
MKPPIRPAFDESRPPVEVPPPIPAFSLTGGLSPLLLVFLSLPAITILLAPTCILDSSEVAKRFVMWIQNLLPFIDMQGHARSTSYPQVAWLGHSLTALILPIMSIIWLWQSMVNYTILLARRIAMGRIPLRTYALVSLVAPALFLAGGYVLISMPGDPSFAKGFTVHSRAGLAILTTVWLYLTSMVLGAQILYIRIFIDTYLKRGA